MSTTTVRLPEDLKARLDKLAASDGKSTHAFMVEALARTADRLERQRAFDAEVQQRWADFQRTGQVVLHEDMKAYAMALAAGKKPRRPKTYAIDALPKPRRKT
jgi:predicted transcriptional regulator